MVVWSVELLEFDLQYEPYDPMKTYFMADFLAEFVDNVQANSDQCNLYVDGASNATLIIYVYVKFLLILFFR